AHINKNTGQADNSVFTFTSINLKINSIEKIAPVLVDLTTNHAPSTVTDADGSNGGSVSEGAHNGNTVGLTASSTDADGDALAYSLIADTSGGGFTINSTTGVV